MPSYNKVIIIGHLTRDVQMRYLPSQTAIAEFGIAANHKYKGGDGQAREEVLFIDCVVFGKQAETLAQYVKKGSALLVEGRLQLDTWDAKDGTKRSKHKMSVESFRFMGGGENTRQTKPEPQPEKLSEPAANEQQDIPF